MKKIFNKLKKTEKPFNVWANEQGVSYTEKADDKKSTINKKSSYLRLISMATSVFIICLAIILPCVFIDFDKNEELKKYTSQDVISKKIEIEEFYEIDNILLFDINQIFCDELAVFIDIANDANIILSYFFNNGLIMASDNENAYWIDYRILIYENYSFSSQHFYSNTSNESLTIGEVTILYEIIESVIEKYAYIKFTYGEYDYYLRVTGFEGVTEISKETIKIILNDLLL